MPESPVKEMRTGRCRRSAAPGPLSSRRRAKGSTPSRPAFRSMRNSASSRSPAIVPGNAPASSLPAMLSTRSSVRLMISEGSGPDRPLAGSDTSTTRPSSVATPCQSASGASVPHAVRFAQDGPSVTSCRPLRTSRSTCATSQSGLSPSGICRSHFWNSSSTWAHRPVAPYDKSCRNLRSSMLRGSKPVRSWFPSSSIRVKASSWPRPRGSPPLSPFSAARRS